MSETQAHKSGAPRLDAVIFADLIAAVALSALAFGAVEPWSLALFELNGLLLGVLLAARFTLGATWRLPAILLPFAGLLLWGGVQLIPFGWRGGVPLSQDPYATGQALLRLHAAEAACLLR